MFPASRSLRTVPGLSVFTDFLQHNQLTALQKKAIQLHKAILQAAADQPPKRCRTYLSKQHNLKSEEYYRLVNIEDITCQHFEKYGEEGHKLTYFIGNDNIPQFMKETLISRVAGLGEVIALTQGRPLNWNFTFNTYETNNKQEPTLAGFDFHKDVESNGEATMIYSIGTPSTFQIRHPNDVSKVETMTLPNNSLVLLSHKARWDFEHRVIPMKVCNSSPLVDDIRRMSLVIGFDLDKKG